MAANMTYSYISLFFPLKTKSTIIYGRIKNGRRFLKKII